MTDDKDVDCFKDEIDLKEFAEHTSEDLHISPHTVKRHIENMLAKTGYKSRVDLAVNARVLGLVVHEDDRTKNKAGKESSERKDEKI